MGKIKLKDISEAYSHVYAEIFDEAWDNEILNCNFNILAWFSKKRTTWLHKHRQIVFETLYNNRVITHENFKKDTIYIKKRVI